MDVVFFGFIGTAQFQRIAGGGQLEDHIRIEAHELAKQVAQDCSDMSRVSGRAKRLGRSAIFTVALPTITPEALSGRRGLSITICIVIDWHHGSLANILEEASVLATRSICWSLATRSGLGTSAIDNAVESLQGPDPAMLVQEFDCHASSLSDLFSALPQSQRPSRLSPWGASHFQRTTGSREEYSALMLCRVMAMGLDRTGRIQSSTFVLPPEHLPITRVDAFLLSNGVIWVSGE